MDLVLDLDAASETALYLQLAGGLRRLVMQGTLHPGQTLPSTRQLCRDLGVSRNTATAAYQRLVDEGYFTVRSRGRTSVSDTLPAEWSQAVVSEGAAITPDLPGLRTIVGAGPAYDPGPEAPIDFRLGMPDLAAFPHRNWLRAYRKALLSQSALNYSADAAGTEALRQAIAAYVGRSRGVRAHADQVVVCSGTQQAISLVARLVLREGDRVAFEDPGYPTARRLLMAHGAHIEPVAVDKRGLRSDRLPPCRLLYVTPSHQYPLGGVLPLERRLELMAWSKRCGAIILEDDYDGEFRFGSRPLPALQGLDADASVLYLGTFSKVLAPGLRLGYIVAPPAIAKALAAVKSLDDRHLDGVTQEALTHFITSGAFEAHLRTMRRLYAAKRATAEAALQRYLPPDWTVLGAPAGLHLALVYTGQRQLEEQQVQQAALGMGVLVECLAPYYHGTRSAHGFLLGYGAMGTDRIEEGVRKLGALLAAID